MKANTLFTICLVAALLAGAISSNAQDPCPNFEWTRGVVGAVGEGHINEGHGIAVDASGNSYIVGGFSGTSAFGGITLTSSGDNDIFVAKLDPQGQFLWAMKAGGTAGELGKGISIDASGNSYITGVFQGTATFGGTTLTYSGNTDVFVAKLDPQGQFLWAMKAGGTFGDLGSGIKVDASGNSYITGYFSETASFGAISLTASGNYDVFVAKLDSQGQFLWAVKAGGTMTEYSFGICLDAAGNGYMTGFFQASTVAFGNNTLTGGGAFVAKLSTQGEFLWAVKAGGAEVMGHGISVDASGNSYITGYYLGTPDFGGMTLTPSNGHDLFVAKVSPQGQFLWATEAGSPGIQSSDKGFGISVDAGGNSYITGYFMGTIIFGGTTISASGDFDVFVAKLGPQGQFLWAVKAGGVSSGNRGMGYGISADAIGNSYIAGYFTGTITLGNTTLTTTSSSGGKDVFISKNREDNLDLSAMSNQTALCGQIVTLNGSATDYSSLLWSPTTGLSSTSSLSPTVSLNQTDTYTLTATDACGQATSESVTINISPYTIDASAASSIISCGTSTQLSSAVSGNVPNVSYLWSPSVGLSSPNIANPIASPSQTTTYTVTGSTASGCSASETLTINVVPFTLNATIASSTIACGTSTQLNATITENVASAAYSWSPTAGLSNPNIANPTAGPGVNTTYTVTVSSPNGCSVSDPITVNVIPFTLNASALNSTINCGTSTQLNAAITENLSGVSYSWSPAIGLSNAGIANPTASPGLTTTYTVTASAANGCSVSDPITINVNNPNPPTVTISSNTGSFNLCDNGLTLSANGFVSYQWDNGSTASSISVSQPGTYTLTAIEGSGCAGQASVEVVPLTEIDAPQGTVLCPNQAGQTLQLNANGGMDSYQWSTGAVSQGIQVSQAGNYTVTVSQGSCTYTESVQVTESNGQATADFSHVADGLTVDFTVISVSINFLSWQFGDGITSFDENPTHTYAQAGTYTVTVTVTDVCGNTADMTRIITVNPVGVEEVEDGSFKLYPNPANDRLYIVSEVSDMENIQLMDMSGRVLLEKQVYGRRAQTDDIEHLASGVYFIKIFTANGPVVRRFVKD